MTSVLHSGFVSAVIVISVLALSLNTSTRPAHASGITSVVFTGNASNPTITINGSGFGSTAPATNPIYTPAGNTAPGITYTCPATIGNDGFDYGTSLWLQDTKSPGGYRMGRYDSTIDELDCIGLLVTSYSDTQVVFTLGAEYSEGGYSLAQGDPYTVYVNGAQTSGTVIYQPGPPPPATPEAPSGVLFGAGIAVALGTLGYRRRRRSRAGTV